MKFMLIFASAVALAVASPQLGVVDPGAAGPAPAPAPGVEPIAIGPAVLEYEPIAIGPEAVEVELPVVPAPAPVIPEDIAPPVAPVPAASPLVQIILNINGHPVSVPGIVAPQPPIDVVADPVHIVDTAPEPVEVGPAMVPEPVAIGVPILPGPAVILPDALN